MKSKLAHGAMSDRYQSGFKAERSDAERRKPMTNQVYLFLVLWVILVCAVADGLAAVIFHVG